MRIIGVGLMIMVLCAACAGYAKKRHAIEDVKWQVVKIIGKPHVAGYSAPYMVFSKGKVQGHSGCNAFGGKYAIEEEELHLTDVVSTKMACADASAMALEGHFFDSLRRRARYSHTHQQLQFYDAKEGIQMVLEKVK